MDNHPLKIKLARKLLGPYVGMAMVSAMGAIATIALTYGQPRTDIEQRLFVGAIAILVVIALLIIISWVIILRTVIHPLDALQVSITKHAQDSAITLNSTSLPQSPQGMADTVDTLLTNFAVSQQTMLDTANENERLNQVAEYRLKELNLVNQINQILLTNVNLYDTINAILHNLKSCFNYTAAEINIWNEDKQAFQTYGISEAEVPLEAVYYYSQDEGFTGWIYQHRRPLCIPLISDFIDVQPKLPRHTFPYESYLGVPILDCDDCLGTLELVHNQPDCYTPDDIEGLQVIANQASVALQHVQLFETTERNMSELSWLHEAVQHTSQIRLFSQISSHISAILDSADLLNEVVNLIANAFDYYYVQIYQIDAFDTTRLVSKNGAGRAQTGEYAVIPEIRFEIDDNSVVGWVATHRKALRVNRVGQEIRYQPNPNLPETQSEIALPLRGARGIFGVLDIQQDQADAFDADDTFNLQALADQLAVAAENARLYAEAVQREQLSSALSQAGLMLNERLDTAQTSEVICQEAVKAFQVHSAYLWLVEGDHIRGVAGSGQNIDLFRGEVVPISDSAVMGARIIQSRQAEFLNEVDFTADKISLELVDRFNVRSLLGVPLVSRNRTLGAIMLLDCENPNRFSLEDQTSATVLANQAAIAIDNARLFEQEQQRVQELDILNQTGQAINATTDVRTLMNVVYKQLSKLMNTESMYVAFYDADTKMLEFPLVKGGNEEHWEPRQAGNGLAEYIISHKVPLLLNDDIAKQAAELGVQDIDQATKSWIGVPMIIGDITKGVIALQDYTQNHAYSAHDVNVLSTIAAQTAVALQNTQLVADLESRVNRRTETLEVTSMQLREERDRVDVLYHIARELSASLDLDRVLNQTLRLIDHAINISKGSILLASSATGQLMYRAAVGRDKPLPRGGKETPYRKGEGLAGHIMETVKPLIISNLSADEVWIPDDNNDEYQSVMAVPLVTGFDVLGVMLLFHTVQNYFTEDHLNLVTAAAPMIATAISNADLFTLVTEQSERTGVLLNRAQTEAKKNEAIIEGIDDGVLVIDIEDTIQLVNPAAATMLGLTKDALTLQALSVISSSEPETIDGQVAQALYDIVITEQHQIHTEDESFTTRISVGNKSIDVILTSITFGTDHNALPSTLVILRDVSREAEVDRIKNEFISTVSHELRTPMTSIKGYIDLLVGNKVGDLSDTQLRFLNTIQSNADRLTVLVNDILEVSGLDAGQVKLEPVSVNIANLAKRVITNIDVQVQEKELKLMLDIPDDLSRVYADPDRVTQILDNLVTNAVKYTRLGDEITVSIFEVHDMVQVNVSDTGLGISPDDKKRVFERFFRAELENESLVDGTGLGLSIAKMFVELMGGQIWVESELGVGSTFSFTVPKQTEIRAIEISDIPADKRRILIVDDNEEILMLLKLQLEEVGFDVLTVSDSKDVIPKAITYQPSLITLDIILEEGKDGFEVLEALKAAPQTKEIPVVIASVLPNIRNKSLALGASDFLVKPFEKNQVLRTVHRLVETVEDNKALSNISRVLIVDDDIDIVSWLTNALTEHNFDVYKAFSGQEALSLIDEQPPDLILLDLKLPDLDGFTVIEMLRAQETTANIPVIVITGSSENEIHERIKVLEEERVITKPFSFQDLVSEIKRLESGE